MTKVKIKSSTSMEKRLQKVLKVLTKNKLHVGFLNNSEHNGPRTDMSNASLALLQEHGTDNIPARPFMTQSLGNKNLVKQQIDKQARRLLKDPKSAMSNMGEDMSHLVKETMDRFSTPANAPATIAKKGSDNPLIETGSLRDSVEYDIRKNERPV